MSRRVGLDAALNGGAGLCLALAVFGVGWRIASERPPAQYRVGMRFANVPGLNLGASPVTLIVWINTQCGACSASMPFYNRLISDLRGMRIVVMSREPVDVLTTYLQSYGVHPAQAVSVGSQSLLFVGTPTLALVGSDSIVRGVWFGRSQSVIDEEAVTRSIRTASTTGEVPSGKHSNVR
jgi:hypothetical protein